MIDIEDFAKNFIQRFKVTPRIFAAPGRVNLIGEHTDYNEGFVLPFAIDKRTLVGIASRENPGINAFSLTLNKSAQIDLDEPVGSNPESWTAYIKGMATVLGRGGMHIDGADILIDSEIPFGAGLSSSAALEVALGLALDAVSRAEISPLDLALAGQQTEHEFIGVKSGIMDQLASALGREDHLLMIDCRSHETTMVRFKPDGYLLVVCDTKVKHNLASSEYNCRREECEEGVRIVKERFPSIKSLRDVDIKMLASIGDRMPAETMHRCRHVITENQRVLDAVEAINVLDYAKLGKLMYASHESLRSDYRVSCPELDLLVEAAQNLPGVVGARMTGGGFGGCTINLLQENSLEAFEEIVGSRYREVFGFAPEFLTVRPSNGARELTVE